MKYTRFATMLAGMAIGFGLTTLGTLLYYESSCGIGKLTMILGLIAIALTLGYLLGFLDQARIDHRKAYCNGFSKGYRKGLEVKTLVIRRSDYDYTFRLPDRRFLQDRGYKS